MNSPLESGLFLPLRFYPTLAEQNRYRPISQGVGLLDETFIYADCTSLLPFQILIQQRESIEPALLAVKCADTGETEFDTDAFPVECWEQYLDVDKSVLWISYLGKDVFAGLNNGRKWIEFSFLDEQSSLITFYSDIFMVSNCNITDPVYELDQYSKISEYGNESRAIDINDLRIR